MKKLSMPFLLLLAMCCNVTAQKKLYRGYYIKQNGDTVYSFMKRVSSEVNPEKIEVSLDSSMNNLVTLSISEIKGFAIFNGDAYKKYTAQISTSFTDFTNMGFNPQINKEQRTVVFREEQVSSDLSLLIYKDKVKERYFILWKNDSIPLELEYHLYKLSEKNPEVIKIENYKRQLKNLIMNNGYTDSLKLNERLRYLAYNDISILRFLNKYLTTSSNGFISSSTFKLSNKTKSRIYVAAGLNAYKYKEPGRDANLINGQTLRFTTSVFGGYDLIIDKEKNNLFVRFEAVVMPTGFKGEYRNTSLGQPSTYERSVFNLFMMASPSLHFTIYNGTTTKVFAGAGLGYATTYSVIKTNELLIFFDDKPVEKSISGELYFPFTIDAYISDKYFVSAGFTLQGVQNLYGLRVFGLRLGYILKSK